MRLFLLFALLLPLAACGFRPVHGRDYRARQELDLSAVAIEVDTSRYGQLLKAEIQDGINPDFERAEKLYKLKISLAAREIYLFVNPDGTSSRGDIEFRSEYALTRLVDGKILQSGKITRVSSYNMSEQADYATYVSTEDAKRRGITELAQDYRLRLSNLMAQYNPQ